MKKKNERKWGGICEKYKRKERHTQKKKKRKKEQI